MKRTYIRPRDRWRYRLDNTFSKGAGPLMAWLAVLTFGLIVLAGLVIAVAGVSINGGEGFIEGAWASLLRTLDPGTMGADVGWGFRIISLLVTLAGLFIVSTLIGLIANAISIKLDDLRKGRSIVAEEGHTLVLGWSGKLMTIVAELMIANENQPGSAIVVMSEHDKVWMEDEIRERVKHNKHTKVVCRTGNISDPQDLNLVNPTAARSVIILSQETEGADAEVIRCVLALMQHDPELATLNVVAEMIDEKNAEALGVATEGRVMTIVSSDVIARITAQVCRQSGLSAVYQELLDFGGDEIYFATEPNVVGMTFAQALHAFDTSTILGLKFADGRIELNPGMDTVIGAGDSVIAIAEDDDKIVFSGNGTGVQAAEAGLEPVGMQIEEHLLIVGWNFLGPRLLHQLDEYVTAGSTVHILYDPDHVAPATLELGEFQRLQVTAEAADTSQEAPLRVAFEARTIDHVIVLCYRDGLTIAESDARTLMTLLQLRRIVKTVDTDEEEISIVTELLDVKDVELARVANPDDFIVSEQLASLLMTQLAENPELGPVFADLFDSYESELMLKPVGFYLPTDQPVRFHEAVAAASVHQEIAVGYRKERGRVDDIVINPNKNDEIEFTDDDLLIVLTTS